MPTDEDNIIYRYTEEQAEADGIKIRLGPYLFCTTNLAQRLAPSATNDNGIDHEHLISRVIAPLLQRWHNGIYYDSGATEYPEEADKNFAMYLVGSERVWAIADGDGLHFILPEDY
jgi:hypothetical protein